MNNCEFDNFKESETTKKIIELIRGELKIVTGIEFVIKIDRIIKDGYNQNNIKSSILEIRKGIDKLELETTRF